MKRVHSQRKFNSLETQTCLVIWIMSVLYAVYQFRELSAHYFNKYNDQYDDFQDGWPILGSRKQDIADFEWGMIVRFVKKIFPHMLVYIVVSEGLRHLIQSNKVKSYFQILWSLIYLLIFREYIFIFLVLFQPVLFVTTKKLFKNTKSVWICNLLCIFLIYHLKYIYGDESVLQYLKISHFEAYLNVLTICWMNLKCTYYSLNIFSNEIELCSYFSYCLYFPTLFTGPFIPFEDYLKTFSTNEGPSIQDRSMKLVFNLTRCAFWMVFTNVALHFVFVNVTRFHPELVSKFDIWQLSGYGYAMGQFFHLKYVILYGLTTCLASFDNVVVPALPRCIGRVHLYSDMWKYFDPGLYQFLKRCIFVPARQRNLHRFFCSFLCFTFVYLWHGNDTYILIWASLNFLGVCLESVAVGLYDNHLKKLTFVRHLSAQALRRWTNVLVAPLLTMSAVSNFYFFAGREIGDIFVWKLFDYAFMNQILLLCAMYCCCEVSTEVRKMTAHQM